MIEVSSLEKTFGNLRAVDGVSFRVGKGELFGILGPNGAGKTTLLRMLCGALHPSRGSIRIGDHDMAREPIKAKALIGYIPEEPNLYGRMTPRGLLAYFAELYGVKEPDIEGLLSMVGLEDRADSRIATFSKGMRQRLGIARGLLHDPAVLIFDEPTMGLDPATARSLREFIGKQKGKRTIILCTHHLEEAELLCDRIAVMSRGSFVALGTPEELKAGLKNRAEWAGKEPTLEDVFVEYVR
jgi:ABC-2 type transport system ATP-binding protein